MNMAKYSFKVGKEKHTILIRPSSDRPVYYDGKLVSLEQEIAGALYSFKVTEKNKRVQYDVEIKLRFLFLGISAIIRRDGKIVYTD